jgi:hypothetical protein
MTGATIPKGTGDKPRAPVHETGHSGRGMQMAVMWNRRPDFASA